MMYFDMQYFSWKIFIIIKIIKTNKKMIGILKDQNKTNFANENKSDFSGISDQLENSESGGQ